MEELDNVLQELYIRMYSLWIRKLITEFSIATVTQNKNLVGGKKTVGRIVKVSYKKSEEESSFLAIDVDDYELADKNVIELKNIVYKLNKIEYPGNSVASAF